MSAARWSVQPLQLADAPQMRQLFARVFGSEMPQALWDWKYGAGRGRALVACDGDGRVVGHYGGSARQVWMFGQAQAAVQICDVMVAQEVRGVLTRRGPLALLTAAFLDAHIGTGKDYLVGFGFPSHRALRVAQHLNLYASVDTVVELHWPAPSPRAAGIPWWQRLDALDFGAAHDLAELDVLWQAQRAGSSAWIVPERNATWWRHRLHEHPVHRYRCFMLRNRWTGRALGAVAMRPGAAPGAAWELMDWIAPVHRVPCILRAARQAALAGGAQAGVEGWFSSTVAMLVRTPDCTEHDIGVQVPTSIRGPGPAPDTLRGRWWLCGADTDFR